MSFVLGSRSINNLVGIHPDLRRIIDGAIVTTTVDFGVTGKAVRNVAEQAALYAQGRTEPGQKVTSMDGVIKVSNHQVRKDNWGHAVDLTPYEGGKYILTERAWDLYPHIASAMSKSARALGLADKLKWGCNWYDTMAMYGTAPNDMLAAVERYKTQHPGKDFLDGPHFELT